VKAGELRHRISIANPSESADGFGQFIETYSSAGSRWAKVEEEQFGEQQINDGTVNKRRISIAVRGNAAKSLISVRSRITFGGEIFNVLSVTDPDCLGQTTVVVAEKAD